MRTAPKIALSLLTSLFLFSALLVASYAGLFTVIETRFYQPSVTATLEKRVETIAEALDQWHTDNFAHFSPFVSADSVKRSLLPNQDREDITDRERRAGKLLADNPGLAGIRIIDTGESSTRTSNTTRRIHFSTFDTDFVRREGTRVAYELYGRNTQEIPFEQLLVQGTQSPKLLLDSATDRFLYIYPFHDSYGAWRGVAVFYVTTGSAVQHLFSKNLVRLSDELHLVHTVDHSLSGVVLDLPRVGTELITNVVLDKWSRNDLETGRIIQTEDSGWMLVSTVSESGRYLAQVTSEDLFTFSAEIRILFLAVSFLTVFLIVFLLFNLRQDDLVVVRNRIRRFQIQLLQEIMEAGDPAYPEKITTELNARKQDINTKIKRGFPKNVRKRHEKNIDEMLSKSWEEILAALGQQKPAPRTTIDAQEIKLMLEQVLQNNVINLRTTGTVTAQTDMKPQQVHPADGELEELGEVEELDELDEVEEIEELGEVEELDELGEAEEIEELDENGELEELGEVEELDENGELEELGEVEELDELGEAEEIEELGEVEELDELGEAEEIKELDENGEAEELAEPGDESSPDTEPLDASEVEYLDGEWEPELLEVATEEELNDFIQEAFPDSVLIYNFEETPGLDSFEHPKIDENEILDDTLNLGGLDFSTLDDDDAEEVTYTDPYPSGTLQRIETTYTEQPVYEFLEVIGEEEPAELLDVDELPHEDDHIVSRDGIFVIAERIREKESRERNTDFQDLVDSVLK